MAETDHEDAAPFAISQDIPGRASRPPCGVYHGTIGFVGNVGQEGPGAGGNNPGHDGSVIVGTFSFRLPPKH